MAAGGVREFDLASYHRRFVALEVCYLGASFQGFARQADSENTIEVRPRHCRLGPREMGSGEGALCRERWVAGPSCASPLAWRSLPPLAPLEPAPSSLTMPRWALTGSRRATCSQR